MNKQIKKQHIKGMPFISRIAVSIFMMKVDVKYDGRNWRAQENYNMWHPFWIPIVVILNVFEFFGGVYETYKELGKDQGYYLVNKTNKPVKIEPMEEESTGDMIG